MTNIITANLAKSRFYRCPPLYQYNYGMILKITGVELPTAYEVDFANDINGQSITQVGNADGVSIPPQFFTPGQAIYCWLRVHPTQDSGITTATIVIPISPRATITDEEPTPEEQSAIDQAIAALNDAVDKAEDAVEHYPTITGGIWYVWDVDAGEYVSTGIPAQGAQGNPGVDGQDGTDGFSPTATVTQTSSGATISITDKTGTTTATVSNGQDGTNGTDGTDGTDAYVYIRYAANEPTSDADMKTTPDAWIGIYSGDVATAPTTYTSYTWYKIKGETGAAGAVQDVQVNGTSVVSDGVANVPVASGTALGVAKVNSGKGITINSNNELQIYPATEIACRNSSSDTLPITPYYQKYAVYFGLAKAAGATDIGNTLGQYTDSAKSAISQMLNGSVPVTGTTPTITALPGIRYVCGEVSTLDITLPSSGIVDVVFQSGSTPTVLTITPPTGVTEVEWADGFDPDNLSANATYWMKVIDGKLGVATAWGVQSGGGGEKPWNHVQFSITTESERTKRFVISNSQAISQIYIKGEIIASSYSAESLCVFVGGKYIGKPATTASATKKYVLLILNRELDAWIGRGAYTEWGNDSGYAGVLSTNSAIGEKFSDGTGDITFSDRWATLDFLEGTNIDVWYR